MADVVDLDAALAQDAEGDGEPHDVPGLVETDALGSHSDASALPDVPDETADTAAGEDVAEDSDDTPAEVSDAEDISNDVDDTADAEDVQNDVEDTLVIIPCPELDEEYCQAAGCIAEYGTELAEDASCGSARFVQCVKDHVCEAMAVVMESPTGSCWHFAQRCIFVSGWVVSSPSCPTEEAAGQLPACQ